MNENLELVDTEDLIYELASRSKAIIISTINNEDELRVRFKGPNVSVLGLMQITQIQIMKHMHE